MLFGGRRRRSIACALVTALAALGFVASLTSAGELAPITCEVPTSKSGAFGITKDPSGNVWFAEEVASKVARLELSTCKFTEIALPSNSNPVAVTPGPDGAMWVTERGTGKVARVPLTATKFSEVTEVSAPGVEWITPGPENSLWITESNFAEGAKIARMTTEGAVLHEYPVSAADPEGKFLTWIAVGPEGDLWFTDYTTSIVGKMTPSGVATGYKLPSGSNPGGIVEGADGNMWFTEESTNKIGRITPKGKITEFEVPTGGSQPEYITRSSGGNLYFSEFHGSKIGRITPDGTISEIALPEGAGPEGIADPGIYGSPWIVTSLNDANSIQAIPTNELFALLEAKHQRDTQEFKEFLTELEVDSVFEMLEATPFSEPSSKGLSGKDEAQIAHDLGEFERYEAAGVHVAQIMGDTEEAEDGAVETYSGLFAADPPRYDFHRYAHAAASSPKLPASLTRHVPHAVVAAADALLANAASFRADAAALLLTFERIQGAFGAGDGEAEVHQAEHGKPLAEKLASLLAAAPALNKRLDAAARRALHGRHHISLSKVRRLARLRGTGLSPRVATLLHEIGLSAKQIKAVGKRAGKAPRSAVTLPEFGHQAKHLKLEAAGVAKARAFAKLLEVIAEGHGGRS